MRVTMSARVDFSSYGFCNVVEGDQLPVMKSLSQFWCVAYLSAFWVAIVNSTASLSVFGEYRFSLMMRGGVLLI